MEHILSYFRQGPVNEHDASHNNVNINYLPKKYPEHLGDNSQEFGDIDVILRTSISEEFSSNNHEDLKYF